MDVRIEREYDSGALAASTIGLIVGLIIGVALLIILVVCLLVARYNLKIDSILKLTRGETFILHS